MPLESLSNEQINIRDLTLEQEKPEIEPAEKSYDRLKESPLYDQETRLWNQSMALESYYSRFAKENIEEGSLHHGKYSIDQFLGLLCEAKIKRTTIRSDLERLMSLPGYNAANHMWDREMLPRVKGKEATHIFADASNQLLPIICQAQYDTADAMQNYDKLKESIFFDHGYEQWNDIYSDLKDCTSVNDHRKSESQLIGVLCEAIFNLENAQKQYESLKKTPLYIEYATTKRDYPIWTSDMYSSQVSSGVTPELATQLLGVLCEAQFDKDKAKELFEKLKKTKCRDNQREHWGENNSMNENKWLRSEYELLNALCEKVIYAGDGQNHNETPPLPETKNF